MSGGDHGHGDQSRFIQHHYDDAQHQFDSGKFGMWIFLAQEVLFFSALFVAYVIYRVHHPEIYSYAHQWLDVKMGAINTAVLIFSSMTAAWAVRAAQLRQRLLLIGCLAVTILCACTFLSIKYLEYSHKIHEHILFGRYFDPCISPGGEELLTKNNECSGTKSTIKWDPGTAKASQGCFDVDKFDTDLKLFGVQAHCQVFEQEITGKGKARKWQDKTQITNQCPDELLLILNANHGEAGASKEAAREAAPKFPCWRPAYQPMVCPDLTTPAERAHGAATKSQFGILVEYNDTRERGNNVNIRAECKETLSPIPLDPMEVASAQKKPGEIGDKAIHPIHVPSEHEQREIDSLGAPPEHTSMFLSLYFMMTGLHGLHVLVGIGVFIWLLIRAVRGDFTPDYFGPVDFSALYWHIVDLIWIFLFPLLYLIH